MSRQPAESFKGYDIFTIAIPTKDGRWSATTEVQKMGAAGLEIMQSFTHPFEAATEAEAKNAALHEAERKIVDLIANPIGGNL
ncbi:hypothetical protein [Undibacterium terreum]|uniref:Uncharacterized protein n=1 Tax=Undibacterium terreum TaxID=1224302 RepID=A0A916V0F1_9BURK|nr:hypothetical protein [Undibacterium terreum]GGC98848.1 hypothetical protein GCM10011396_52970 [Undibacterium terreum]